jgi:GT2 family glycosyltransferase
MLTKSLNISIVCYNNSVHQIENLIDSIDSSYLNKIFIVDNSPNSTLGEKLSNLKVEYIKTVRNIGFGSGHNIALKHSLANNVEYHLVLNPDIILDGLDLDDLVNRIHDDKDFGAIMPRVKYMDGNEQFLCKLLPSPFDLFIRRFLPKYIFKNSRIRYNLLDANYNIEMSPPSLSGCFLLLRMSILRDLGFFDERYFMYCEDLDLCRRIRKNHKLLYYPKQIVKHGYSKGSYRSLKLLIYHIVSAIRYFNKWGWYIDKDRKIINEYTLNKIKELNV